MFNYFFLSLIFWLFLNLCSNLKVFVASNYSINSQSGTISNPYNDLNLALNQTLNSSNNNFDIFLLSSPIIMNFSGFYNLSECLISIK